MKAAVLDVLSDFEHPVPERMIVLALKVHLRVMTTLTDLRAILKKMEAENLVAGVTDHDGVVVWALRSEGKLFLAGS